MVSNRQFRLIGVSLLSIILITILYRSNTASKAILSPATLDTQIQDSKQQTLITSNNLIDSNNDDKLDAAINNEILKLGGGNEEMKEESEIIENTQEEKIEQTIENIKNVDDGKTNDQLSKPVTANNDEILNKNFDPAKELIEIRSLSPMTIFSKTYCPYSKKVKKLLLDNYQITPQPSIVELDKHSHGAELQEYLSELTGRHTVPNILVGSTESRGGADDFIKLHEQGILLDLLNQWGEKDLDVKKVETPSNS